MYPQRKRGIQDLSSNSMSSIGLESPSSFNPDNYALTQEEMAQDVVWEESPPQNAFDHFDFESSNVDDLASLQWTRPVVAVKRFKPESPKRSLNSSSGSDAFDALMSSMDDSCGDISTLFPPSPSETAPAESHHPPPPQHTLTPSASSDTVNTMRLSAQVYAASKDDSQDSSSGSQPGLAEVEVAAFVFEPSSTANISTPSQQQAHDTPESISGHAKYIPPHSQSALNVRQQKSHVGECGTTDECSDFDLLMEMTYRKTALSTSEQATARISSTSSGRPHPLYPLRSVDAASTGPASLPNVYQKITPHKSIEPSQRSHGYPPRPRPVTRTEQSDTRLPPQPMQMVLNPHRPTPRPKPQSCPGYPPRPTLENSPSQVSSQTRPGLQSHPVPDQEYPPLRSAQQQTYPPRGHPPRPSSIPPPGSDERLKPLQSGVGGHNSYMTTSTSRPQQMQQSYPRVGYPPRPVYTTPLQQSGPGPSAQYRPPTSSHGIATSAVAEVKIATMDELAEFDMLMEMASQAVAAKREVSSSMTVASISPPKVNGVRDVANLTADDYDALLQMANESLAERKAQLDTPGARPPPIDCSSAKAVDAIETISLDDYDAILKMEAAALASRGRSQSTSAITKGTSSGRQMVSIGREQCPSNEIQPFTCHRFIALDVLEARDDKMRRYKHILCFPTQSAVSLDSDRVEGRVVSVFLYDDWCEGTDIKGGDVFHVVDIVRSDLEDQSPSLSRVINCGVENELRVDGTKGLVIVNPDMLITPTRIAESCSCLRKGVLSERIRGLDGGLSGAPAVMGNLKHMFIEKMFALYLLKLPPDEESLRTVGFTSRVKNHSSEDIFRIIYECIAIHAEAICSIGMSDDEAFSELHATIGPVMEWITKCISRKTPSLVSGKEIGLTRYSSSPSAFSRNAVGGSSGNITGCGPHVTIVDVLGTEETLCSASLGMKGQVDMIVEACVGQDRSYVIPVELKTGKWSAQGVLSHRAQTILYVLMVLMRERNMSSIVDVEESPPDSRPGSKSMKYHGLLLYLGAKDSSSGNILPTKHEVVTPTWPEIKGLVQARNKLAVHGKLAMSENIAHALPPLQRNSSCEWCFKASECMTYHRTAENGSEASSGVPDLFRHITSDISVTHAEYFMHWDTLIDLEAQAESNDSQRIAVSELRAHTSCTSNEGHSGISGLSVKALDCDMERNAPMPVTADGEVKPVSWTLTLSCVGWTDSAQCRQHFALPTIGERVSISIEFCQLESSCLDIEDTCLLTRSCQTNISGIEVMIATGAILSYDSARMEICVTLTDMPKRFQRICQWAIKAAAAGELQVYGNRMIKVRLDRDEFQGSMAATLRSNILRLIVGSYDPRQFMARKDRQASHPFLRTPHLRLRNLVIDMQPPQFDSGEVPDGISMFAPEAMDGNKYLAALKILRKQQQGAMRCNDVTYIHGIAFYRGCLPFDLLREYCDLNADQQAAVAKVLSAKDYVLLLGMPGTGKTSTIAFVVRMMVAKGARVLITSYTHSAVDNLLEKLVARGTSPRILGRIGSKTSVRIPLHPYLLNEPSGMEHDQSKVLTSTTKRISGLRVVGCTVLTAARHALLQTMKFDWCVTDESGQISQPASLGPLMLSSRFLLVGDDYQLPPIVQSREAAAKGMDVSLFKRLGEAHPEAVTTLTSQYRMNDQVMALCNTLIYEHRLSCGNDDVARARLCLLKSEALGSFVNSELSHLHSWLNSALDPSRCVVFLNTDSIDFQLSHVHLSSSDDMNDSSNLDSAPIGPPLQRSNSPRGRGQSTSNAEVVVVRALVKQLKACGVDLSGVGIISPYRAQVRVLQQALQQTCNSIEEWNATAEEGPVVSTVDKFQGRDMDMIVISMVRNMQDNSAGELLRDWRRVNVAISRARYKLVFIGSLLLMRTVPILSQLAHFCEARDAVTDLPASIKTCIDI